MVEQSKESATRDADLRVSDSERERVVHELSLHAAEGRLDLEELDARTDRALAARTRAELDAVTSDLPRRPERAPFRRRARRAPLSPLSSQLALFVAVNLVLVAVWALTGGGHFWPAWSILGWGLGLVKGGGSVHRRAPVGCR